MTPGILTQEFPSMKTQSHPHNKAHYEVNPKVRINREAARKRLTVLSKRKDYLFYENKPFFLIE